MSIDATTMQAPTTHVKAELVGKVSGTQGLMTSIAYQEETTLSAPGAGSCTDVQRIITSPKLGPGRFNAYTRLDGSDFFIGGRSLELELKVRHVLPNGCPAVPDTTTAIGFDFAAQLRVPGSSGTNPTTLRGTSTAGSNALNRVQFTGHSDDASFDSSDFFFGTPSESASITYDLALGQQASLMAVAPPLPGRVAYIQGAPPCPLQCTQRVMTVNADGSGVRILTKGYLDQAPQWSPDGKRLVFTRIRHPRTEGCCEIWVMNSDGSNARELTTAYTAWGQVHPTWSHDGKSVIFENDLFWRGKRSVIDDGGTTLEAVKANGQPTIRKLFRLPGAWQQPRVSPDGTRIVLSKSGESIWTMNLAGGDRREVIARPTGSAWPSWSPDGTRLSFTGVAPSLADEDSSFATVWTMPATGGEAIALWNPSLLYYSDALHENESSPVWSPDGRFVLYGSQNWLDGAGELHLVSVTTGEISKLPIPRVHGCHGPQGSPAEWCAAYDPDWSNHS